MAQVSAGTGFVYPYDINVVLEPWRKTLGEDFDRVAALLADRDRALETYFQSAIPVFDQISIEEGTTSTTDTDLATVGPVVTIKLPRGSCILQGGAFVTSTATGQTAVMSLFIDGVFAQDIVLLGNNTGGSVSASLSSQHLYTGLGPGSHEFKAKYLSSNGVEVRFDERFLVVQPVA